MTNTTNTNTAREFRANTALVLLGIAGFISLFIITDALRYNVEFSAYLGGAALWQAAGAYLLALALLGWNVITYEQPRYARSRG